MNLTNLYFQVVPLLSALAVVIIGVVVFLGNRREKISLTWFLLCLLASVWSLFFFLVINASSKGVALIMRIFMESAAVIVLYCWLKFVLQFLGIENQVLTIYSSVGTVAMLLLNVSPWFIKDMAPRSTFEYYVVPNWGYYIFAVYFASIAVIGLVVLFREYTLAEGIRRKQIRNIFIGSIMGFAGGGSTFILSFHVDFPPYLFILFAAFPIIIGRGIVRYKLFNIKVVAAELLTLSIWVFLAIRLMFSETTQDIVINAFLLIAVIFFGILLVKSVWNEVRQRERIEKLAKELEEANKRQEALIHFVSHEVKGYMTKSEGAFAAMIEGDVGQISPEAKSMAELALAEDRKGVKAVTDILQASNLKTGKVKYEMKTFDLRETIDKLVADFRKDAATAGIKFETDTAGAGRCVVNGDEGQLSGHVFENLLRNTIAYAAGANVWLKLQKRDGKILFSLKDTGVGMSPKTLANLFTEGGRGEDALKVNAHSTGYGLFIAKGIVDAHHGKIWAESEGAGKGSTFFVELPLVI